MLIAELPLDWLTGYHILLYYLAVKFYIAKWNLGF